MASFIIVADSLVMTDRVKSSPFTNEKSNT
jgi:hypothetical protein